ncbi:putative ABC transporter permease [Neobacillus bataviensis]|uniref:putative ABC transporter permease n=1 Tax=Neobacillus bataviensis TaxID=220685 RepID=UPI001CBD8AC3|nr:putative ABC transporter permease [Neobacillus bataviensis]
MIISLLNGFEVQNPGIFNIEGAAAILFYFTVYALLGWLLENSYNFLTKKRFLKENFLYGPFKPMYGLAPVLLVYLIRPETHWGVALLLCFVIPTLVEYLTGALLLKFFKRQWWDYSDTPLQLHGHICLPFSVCWVVLSFLCLKGIHPLVVTVYGIFEPYWAWIWGAVGLYFLADLALSIRRHSLQEFDRVSDTLKTPSD